MGTFIKKLIKQKKKSFYQFGGKYVDMTNDHMHTQIN